MSKTLMTREQAAAIVGDDMTTRVYDLYVKHTKAGNVDYLKSMSRHYLGNDMMINVESSMRDELVFDAGNVRLYVCSDINGLPVVYSLGMNDDDVESAAFNKEVLTIVMNMSVC